jgi:hypothetical protein
MSCLFPNSPKAALSNHVAAMQRVIAEHASQAARAGDNIVSLRCRP